MIRNASRPHRKVLAIGLSLAGLLLSTTRHAWSQG